MVLSTSPLRLSVLVLAILRVVNNAMMIRTIRTVLTTVTVLDSVLTVVALLARPGISAAVSSVVLIRVIIGVGIHRELRLSKLAGLTSLGHTDMSD